MKKAKDDFHHDNTITTIGDLWHSEDNCYKITTLTLNKGKKVRRNTGRVTLQSFVKDVVQKMPFTIKFRKKVWEANHEEHRHGNMR